MATTNTVVRSLHDLGLAAWFGGSLMGNLGVNGGAAAAREPTERLRIAGEGWDRWAPVNAAAVAATTLGGIGLTLVNRSRLVAQRGVATTATVKAAVTFGAMAASGYARVLGRRLESRQQEPVEGPTTPAGATAEDVAGIQRQLRVVQWSVTALTGTMVVINAYMGEQQRPKAVVSGTLGRLTGGRGGIGRSTR